MAWDRNGFVAPRATGAALGCSDALDRELAAFIAEQTEQTEQAEQAARSATGVVASVILDDRQWVGAAGELDADDEFWAWSASKLMTTALVHIAVLDRTLHLDQPAQRYLTRSLGPFATVTIRHLLAHRSGIVDYRSLPGLCGGETPVTPELAVAAALARPPLHAPGVDTMYGSTNGLLLGEALEETYGESFEALTERLVLRPLGMDRSSMHHTLPGRPGGSTGGLLTTAGEFVVFVDAWLGSATVERPRFVAHLRRSIGPDGVGEGVLGFPRGAGGPDWIGYHGAHTLALFDPDRRVSVVVHTDRPLHGRRGIGGAVHALADRLAALAA